MGLCVWLILCILELLFSYFSYFTVLATENWYTYAFLYYCTLQDIGSQIIIDSGEQ